MASNGPESPTGGMPPTDTNTPNAPAAVQGALDRAATVKEAKKTEDAFYNHIKRFGKDTLWNSCKVLHDTQWDENGEIYRAMVAILDTHMAGLTDAKQQPYMKRALDYAKNSYNHIRSSSGLNINKVLLCEYPTGMGKYVLFDCLY